MTDTGGSGDSKTKGVEFAELNEQLAAVDYPIDVDELLDEHGSQELEFQEGSATLAELFEPMGDQSFETKDEVEQAVLTMVDEEAIGRKYYTDRGVSGGNEEYQQESF